MFFCTKNYSIIYSNNITITSDDIIDAYKLSNSENKAEFKIYIKKIIKALDMQCHLQKYDTNSSETIADIYNNICNEYKLNKENLEKQNISKISVILAYYKIEAFSDISNTLDYYHYIYNPIKFIIHEVDFVKYNSVPEVDFTYFNKKNKQWYSASFSKVHMPYIKFSITGDKILKLNSNTYIYISNIHRSINTTTHYDVMIWNIRIADYELLKNIIKYVEPYNPYSFIALLEQYPNHFRIDYSYSDILTNQNERGNNIINYIINSASSNGFAIYDKGNGYALALLTRNIFVATLTNKNLFFNCKDNQNDFNTLYNISSSILC